MILMPKFLHKLFIFMTSMLLLAGCSDHPNELDLSDVDLEMEVLRFDQDLFQSDSIVEIAALEQKYPEFYPAYVGEISPIFVSPQMSREEIAVELYRFIKHPDMRYLYDRVQEEFKDVDDLADDLEEAAKYIHHYFPEDKITKLYTYISSFEYAGAYLPFNEKAFCVGLDMYMGADFEIYPQLPANRFPHYRLKRLEPHFMVANALHGYLDQRLDASQLFSFVDEAVYEGKKLYAMDLFMPKVADSIKIGYLNGQTEWCVAHAENIWGYLIEEDLLFSTDKRDFTNKFFNDGPFTSPLGEESPARIGAWVGSQIVRTYMKRNPELSLQDLFAEQDHQKIFDQSKYKP
jgi:hypothetical protein